MFRLTVLVYVMAATVLSGIAVIAALATPALADDLNKWIPVGAGAGALVALPLSYMIAKSIDAQIRKR